MANVTINGANLGEGLRGLLDSDDIKPGDTPSYQLCKSIYVFHPLGAKLAEIPVRLAQSKPRVISVPGAPGERVKQAFLDEWKKIGADKHLFNLHRLKRIYGIAAIALLTKDEPTDQAVNYEKLWNADIAFNVFDPLNVAGSLVGNLDPNSPGFLKTTAIAAAGQPYHRTRSVVAMNEEPIYLEYTSSGFGYVGRSVYQRTLYPLKSFIETMVADGMVARKAGLIVAKIKAAGAIIDKAMKILSGLKRSILKEAKTDNVIQIGTDESVETLDMQNVNAALDVSRKHILENIASGAGMPSILITQETFASGLSEGTEDADAIADFVNQTREEMDPSYAFFDEIVQWRAWNPEFYATIQNEFPEEYGNKSFAEAFRQWSNSFTATWPSFLEEPESERVKVDDVRLKALIAAVQVGLPALPAPENQAELLEWFQRNVNEIKTMFTTPLEIDFDIFRAYKPPVPEPAEEEPKPAHPFAAQDSQAPRRARRKAA